MTALDLLPIFDGHNDVLQSIYLPKDGKPRPFFELNESGHLDLPRMRQGGFAGGFFAVFVPSGTKDDDFPGADSKSGQAEYALPLPPTIELTIATIIMALLIAVPVGVISSLKPGSFLDRMIMSGALLGISMPNFWFGLILILFFCVFLGWLPTSGQIGAYVELTRITGFLTIDAVLTGNWSALKEALTHLLLPAITLGVTFSAIMARVIRSSMLETLRMEYVVAARAKGVSEVKVVLVHAFRNAMIPAVTVAGLEVGMLLGGNMIVETIFAWPGLGRLVVASIFSRDYVVVQSAVMLYALTYAMANLSVDILYTMLNPRIEL